MTPDRFKLYTRLGAIAALAFIVSPIVFTVIKGLAGAVTVIVMMAILNALVPAFSEWLTQLKFKGLKFVIDRGPVETLQQREQERFTALQEQSGLLRQQASLLELYKKKSIAHVKQFPEEAESQAQNLKQYEELFAYRVEAFKTARQDNAAFSHIVRKAESTYEMAVADAELGKSFGKQGDFMTAFKERYALEAVDKAAAESLATLRMAVIDNDYAAKVEAPAHAITYDKDNRVVLGTVLDVQAVPR